MKFSTVLEGADECVAALKALPSNLGSKNGGPVRKGLYRIAKEMQKTAKELAPRSRELLVDSIKVVRDKNPARSKASERYVLGVFGGMTRKYANNTRNRRTGRVGRTYTIINAYYWRFQEFGTTRGIKAKKFLDKAFRRHATPGIDDFTTLLKADLDRIARKLNRSPRKS